MLVENKIILNEKRKILHDQTIALNETKQKIDNIKSTLDLNKLMHGKEEKETVLEEEEFDNIHRLTELKGLYKELLNEIQALRPQIEHCQLMVEQARHKMLTEFDTWYNQLFPQNNALGRKLLYSAIVQ